MRLLDGGSLTQRLRLVSGLVLFLFALTHFLNHAVGLWSIEAMNVVQGWRTALTFSVAGSIVLALALIVHMGLALAKLARRATLKLPAWELAQVALGLAIPFYLIPHMVATRAAHELFGVMPIYEFELVQLWPGKAPTQSLLLLLVWAHGCIGLHFWLRLRSWYRQAFPVPFALAVLVPAAALAGFVVSGRASQAILSDPALIADMKARSNWPDRAAIRTLLLLIDRGQAAFLLILPIPFLLVAGRWIARRSRSQLAISYLPDVTVRAEPGPTLLEISRMNGVPHASVCGGRARCSTCRVRVDEGADQFTPATDAEAETLARIQADPDVRLACQIRPTRPLTVTRLVRPTTVTATRSRRQGEAQGVERTCAVLFLDVRGFTSMSENKLPYDVVFILNRFFAGAGAAIAAHGGWIDKYLGDGLMAVFGRSVPPEEASRQALRAAADIDRALDNVNHDLHAELADPLRIGIGVHAGPLVLGEIGHADTAAMTVIGRTVNTAARLEAATKEKGCQLILSLETARLAGLEAGDLAPQPVNVRGLSEPLDVICIEHARTLELGEAATEDA